MDKCNSFPLSIPQNAEVGIGIITSASYQRAYIHALLILLIFLPACLPGTSLSLRHFRTSRCAFRPIRATFLFFFSALSLHVHVKPHGDDPRTPEFCPLSYLYYVSCISPCARTASHRDTRFDSFFGEALTISIEVYGPRIPILILSFNICWLPTLCVRPMCCNH